MEVGAPATLPAAASAAGTGSPAPATHRLTVSFEHGIHARPAALLAGSLRTLAADVRLIARGREANARSTVALMALGVPRGEESEIRAAGPDAENAVRALVAIFAAHSPTVYCHPGPSSARKPAPSPGAAPPPALSAERTELATASPDRLSGVMASPGLAVGSAL